MKVNQTAIDSLSIIDISFQKESIELRDAYIPAIGGNPEQFIRQTSFKPVEYFFGEINTTSAASNEQKTVDSVHFVVVTGVRFISRDALTELDDLSQVSEEDIKPYIVAELQCIFNAHYAINKPKDDIPKECLDDFLRDNVPYHVWPYWRSWVESTCMRYRLPHTVIGFYHAPKSAQVAPSDKKKS